LKLSNDTGSCAVTFCPPSEQLQPRRRSAGGGNNPVFALASIEACSLYIPA